MSAFMTVPPTRLPGSRRLALARRRGAHHPLGAIAGPTPGQGDRGIDPLLTADEVAQLLRMTKAWVYAETRAKRIPHVPLGRYVRYRRSAVLQWIGAIERESVGARRS